MKNILITGVNSYVGNRLAEWLEQYPENYKTEKISLRDGSWKEKDFSSYDVVVHVAGIAHRKETKENAHLYYEINRDLVFEIAQKAKKESVKHFIFLSSMSVYGLEKGVIDENTTPDPKSNYGKSKLEAENLIQPLENENFKIAIIRPPMIYGRGCKGNYQRLAKLAKKTPVFPKIDNKRSMIYIDNLSEFMRLLIDEEEQGMFFPQNTEYVCTSELVEMIAEVHNRNIHMTKLFNPFIKLLKVNTVNKVFGSLIYDMNLSKFGTQPNCFKESIELTESGRENDA